MSRGNHYINNKEFFLELKDYIYAIRAAEAANESVPRIPDSIGAKILQISTNLAYKPNFINYTFRDDMIGDGIENCIRYIKNFNPDKYNNAFAYITTICFQAFVRRIQREGRQFQTKIKYVHNAGIEGLLSDVQDHDIEETYSNSYVKFLQELYDQPIPEKKNKKKKSETVKKSNNGLDGFIK